MGVNIILRDLEYEVEAGQTIQNGLDQIGIQPESVLATRNGELLTDDEVLQEGDVIKLVAVISGGGLHQ